MAETDEDGRTAWRSLCYTHGKRMVSRGCLHIELEKKRYVGIKRATYATGRAELDDLPDCSAFCRTHIENIHRAL